MFQILFLVFMFGAMYFLMIAPQRKKQKEHDKMLKALTTGDEIVTTGGIIGEVKDVIVPVDGPTELILEIAPGVRVRALTDSVLRRLSTLEPAEPTTSTAEPTAGEVSHTSA